MFQVLPATILFSYFKIP